MGNLGWSPHQEKEIVGWIRVVSRKVWPWPLTGRYSTDASDYSTKLTFITIHRLLADLGGDERRKKGRNTLMMKEPSSLQEEQCNGQGHASIVENADFMPVLEGAHGGSVQNTNIISDQGNVEHGSPRSGDGEDSKVQATSSDVGDDPVGPLPRRWMSRNC
ncbi:uncharacterized protein LOC124693241 isoform X2 [Lolium rigidum]|uniref:uncharacterized protein LOC124693241 isoform X2 n=1 Tax=Lolium rigidum TaxID=89674 RepID=UPI001F5C479D|nr:uncharacterized protein LOC124693241 isoform X2 [Lolium rigidum]